MIATESKVDSATRCNTVSFYINGVWEKPESRTVQAGDRFRRYRARNQAGGREIPHGAGNGLHARDRQSYQCGRLSGAKYCPEPESVREAVGNLKLPEDLEGLGLFEQSYQAGGFTLCWRRLGPMLIGTFSNQNFSGKSLLKS